MHHSKRQKAAPDAAEKARQGKARMEQAIANATGLRILAAVTAAVPVRLMKRDLLFLGERMLAMLDERRQEIAARNHAIRKTKEADSITKLLSAFLRKADEGVLGRLLVEFVILNADRTNTGHALKDAAQHYRVDVDAIALKVKHEFAAKAKAHAAKKPAGTAMQRPAKKKAA